MKIKGYHLAAAVLIFAMCMTIAGCKTGEHKDIDGLYLYDMHEPGNGMENTEVVESSIIKEVTIRAESNRFDPEVIRVSQGDKVVIYVTNLGEQASFSIESYEPESTYYTGQTLYYEFMADVKGEFVFGDSMSKGKKGMLIVE